ncbi:transposase [Pseudomonas umsongensis]|jgi:putative transposase|uniref:IS481 family transposase n=3 Tax=Pseudomonas umsongensis TaxID=198618 RepID=A0ABX4DZM0_9PSED|nr:MULTISPECIES: integrase core domain-containing protein [Pseudomonas]KEX90720.1 integrase [Pseudomonas putida]EPA92967.1 transposase [Pseudomonas sp. G5(2012)]OXR27780.1 IS481 family transposase [Pseudomonas umsongensis]OXR28207.1 IS481 family transposase [Pseudomonas umsongensis]OXR34780.1 IS481 family transposase [Pseudomonas umsongensis]
MPWRELKPMDLKVMFIADYLSGRLNFSQLCAAHSISRKTGYKWVARYNADSINGLAECSRKRHSQAQAVPFAVKEAILELRGQGQTTPGPKKIQTALRERFPDQPPPSKTTIYNVLKKAGLVVSRRLRQRVAVYPKPLQKADLPNQLWSADYKGQYLTGDGVWCYPLTVMDHASRFLLACESMPSTTFKDAKATFERLFKMYGMPERIRTDNGVPFASGGRAGLSQLSIWWARLGIIHERIQPGRPEQNGRHERMHRTLKSTLPRPPEIEWGAQQKHFDLFMQHYNHERLHEALGQKTPGSCYTSSSRAFPRKLPEMKYPSHVEAYRTDSNGVVNKGRLRIYVGYVLKHQIVGLENISEGAWDIIFGPVLLGRVDERDAKDGYLTLKVIKNK